MEAHFTCIIDSTLRWNMVRSLLSRSVFDALPSLTNDPNITTSKLLEYLSKTENYEAISLIKQWISDLEMENLASSNTLDAEQLYQKGLEWYLHDRFTASVPFFEKAAELNYPPALLRLFMIALRRGHIEKNKKYAQAATQYKDWFSEQTKSGDPFAQHNWGIYVDLIEKNEREAMVWYTKAAEQGFLPAQNNLAACLRDLGKVDESVAWFSKAAGQGNLRACYNMGWCYYNGLGVPKNLSKAVEWYQKAADMGDVDAQLQLGWCYTHAKGIARDCLKALYWYQKAADQEVASGFFHLALLYEDGSDDAPQDLPLAIEYYEKAASYDFPEALYNLGLCYLNGNGGVQKDLRKALELVKRSAMCDNPIPESQYLMGYWYFFGMELLPRDVGQGLYWIKKSADQGFDQAQTLLGRCYMKGEGLPKDLEKGIQLYQLAASKDHAEAQFRLAKCYFDGVGVAPHLGQAMDWLQKAVYQGHAQAQLLLGRCYEYGEGVPQDFKQAMYWMQQAADQLHWNAKTAIKRLNQVTAISRCEKEEPCLTEMEED